MANKLFTKGIVLLLLLSMTLSLAVSCGGAATTTKPAETTAPAGADDATGPANTTTPAVTTTTPTTQVAYPVQLEGIKDDLEDTIVQFIYVEGEEGFYTAKSLWVDEEVAGELDAVDQQTIDRNNRIYEDIGVTIEPITDPTLSIWNLYTYAKTYFDVQDPGLDVYCGFQYYD